MVGKKKILINIGTKLVYLFLILFPFGQVLRVELNFLNYSITILAVDIIAALSLFVVFLFRAKKPLVLKYINIFVLICIFSLIHSLGQFDVYEVFYGSLYLIRFVSYIALFVLTWNLLQKNYLKRDKLIKYLVLVSLTTAFLGLIQYFWLPDTRFLYSLGWDKHLYRLIGTFLDPTYTGIIITLGATLAMALFAEKKLTKYLIFSATMIVAVLLTYSRASYLALLFGIFVILLLKSKIRYLLIIFTIFAFTVINLPRPGGEGVKLERVFSIESRVENYRQTFEIIKAHPVFGIGFNNMCTERLMLYGGLADSHSCSGSDMSILFIVATTGVVGLITFIYMSYKIIISVKRKYAVYFLSIAVALFVHSLFSNSLFYSWIMGYVSILTAVSIKG